MNASLRTLAVTVIVCGLAPFLAATQPRHQPPPPGAPRDFAVPEVRRFTLANGLRVRLVPFGHVPKVTIRAVIAAGKVYEGRDGVWLADLTGNLLREGTETLRSDALAERFAALGGDLSIAVRPDVIAITCEVLSDHGPEALQLLADVVRRPAFTEPEFIRVKSNLLRLLAIRRNTPQAAAEEKFRQVIYGDHPYGRLFPEEAALERYTIEEARRFYRAHFGGARTRLYVAGVFDPIAIEAAIRKGFESWEPGRATARPVVARPATPRFELVDKPNAAQSTVMLGLRVPDPAHPDWVALEVTNALLGGGFSSRIVANIREQKGYTYSPDSMLSPYPGQAHWVQTADVTTNATGLSIKEIFHEIQRLRTEAPAELELEGTKRYLVGSFLVRNASRASIITQLAFVDLHGLAPDYLSQYVRRVMAVTPRDVRRIARKYLVPDKMSLVVVGDVKAIRDQVGPWSKR